VREGEERRGKGKKLVSYKGYDTVSIQMNICTHTFTQTHTT